MFCTLSQVVRFDAEWTQGKEIMHRTMILSIQAIYDLTIDPETSFKVTAHPLISVTL